MLMIFCIMLLTTCKHFKLIIKQLLNLALVLHKNYAGWEGCYPPPWLQLHSVIAKYNYTNVFLLTYFSSWWNGQCFVAILIRFHLFCYGKADVFNFLHYLEFYSSLPNVCNIYKLLQTTHPGTLKFNLTKSNHTGKSA